jgi:hypothetical protein
MTQTFALNGRPLFRFRRLKRSEPMLCDRRRIAVRCLRDNALPIGARAFCVAGFQFQCTAFKQRLRISRQYVQCCFQIGAGVTLAADRMPRRRAQHQEVGTVGVQSQGR